MSLALPPGLWPFFVAWSAVVGAVIGSFLNVVIARVPAGESIVHPPSRCPRCGARIAWYDNVPIVAWLWLRGRCRRCHAPISARYPLVEALGAAAGALAAWRHGPSLAAVAELTFVALLLALSFIDLDTWTLPHALTWPLIAVGLAASAAGVSAAPGLRSAAIGAALGFAVFAAVALVGERLLRREAMGWGDVYLLAGLGAWLGAPALLPVVLLASVQGSVVGIVLILLGRAQPGPEGEGGGAAAEAGPAATDPDDDWVPPKHSVPFGPFLAAGALEWLFASGWLAGMFPVLEAFR